MVHRVDAILRAFGPLDRAVGVSELARRTGLSKATVWRITGELVEVGALERTEGGLRPGVGLFEIGVLATRPSDLRRIAVAHMSDLRSATRQTVHLAILDGAEVVYIEILRSRTAPPLPSRVGGRVPAYATGVGKALLAYLPLQTLEKLVPPTLIPVGPRTIVDRSKLITELAQIRESGIAYEREESAPHSSCAAAAIFGADGEAIAALSASAQLGSVDLAALGPAVSTAAHSISREAGRLRLSF